MELLVRGLERGVFQIIGALYAVAVFAEYRAVGGAVVLAVQRAEAASGARQQPQHSGQTRRERITTQRQHVLSSAPMKHAKLEAWAPVWAMARAVDDVMAKGDSS